MKYKQIKPPVKHKFTMTQDELYTLMSLITKYGDLKRAALPDSDRNFSADEQALINTFDEAYRGRGF